MATVVLSIAGSIIGGPVGASIGAAIGQQIDQRVLFKPKGRDGPRLGDLSVQTSNYGARIPAVFGRARLSGTVIWATDLIENRKKQSTGKNQPKVTTYSYSANFAVALSCRNVSRIGRIWADGKLLRGAAGDFKTPTQFRFYSGAENQPLDPLIASAEGAGQAPAYRGLAYAVFEDMQLSDYGNRIPSISFEVIADEGDVSVADIVHTLMPENAVAIASTSFSGFVASGETARSNVETIASLVPLHVTIAGQNLEVRELALTQVGPTENDLGADQGEQPAERTAIDRVSTHLLPSRLTLSYAEPDRDYQPGLQRVRREASSLREEALALPVTLNTATAVQLAHRALASRWASRERLKIALPFRYAGLLPGARISVPGRSGPWQIISSELEAMVVKLTLQKAPTLPFATALAEPGRGVTERDMVHGPTVLQILDLPIFDDRIATEPLVYVAASGQSPGWRRAPVLQSTDQGVSWQDVGITADPAIQGTTLSRLGQGTCFSVDRVNTVDVILLNTEMQLEHTDFEGLVAGRNLALIGQELIQFEKAERINAGHYRLSGLMRGRRGTEWAIAIHAVGEPFVLIEADSLLNLQLPIGIQRLKLKAFGVGDGVEGASAEMQFANVANALRPLSPVHLTLQRNGADYVFQWIRRSRAGWSWLDAVDAPLGEEKESYTMTLTLSDGATLTYQTQSPILEIAQNDLPSSTSDVMVTVVQNGIYGASLPRTQTFLLPV